MEKLNGVVEKYYDNGQLESRKNYKNDKLNGLWEDWYANGQLKSRKLFKDGKFNGLCEAWDRDGKLWTKATYKNDNLNGLSERWYSNGQLWVRENYKNDKRDGLSESWYKDGNLVESTIYKDGVVEYIPNKHEQNMVEQESNKNVSEEELLRLCRENLAMKIMVLRDKQIAREITLKESLKQSVRLFEEYDKYKIENQL